MNCAKATVLINLENKPKVMQEVETEWADWQLWHGVPFFVRAWYGCSDASASLTPEMRVRLAEHGGQTAPPRGWGKPLLISVWVSAGTFRPVECVYTSVCLCVLAEGLHQSGLRWTTHVLVQGRVCVVTVSEAGIGPLLLGPHLILHPSVPPLSHQGGSCSEPHLILGQWVAGLWGIFWGSFWNVLCHSVTIREQWRKRSLWL